MTEYKENKKLGDVNKNVFIKYMDYVKLYLENNIDIIPCNLYLDLDKKRKICRFPLNYKEEKFNIEDFESYGYNSIAIRTGEKNNLTVIDVDKKDRLDFVLNKLEIEKDESLLISTNKGYHLYFKYNYKYPNVAPYYENIDIRNDGGIIYAPGSQYKDKTGKIYTYEVNGGEFEDFLHSIKNINDNVYILDDKFINAESPICSPPDSPKGKEDILDKRKKSAEDKHEEWKKKHLNVDFEKIEKAVMLLDVKRSIDYEDWRNVGFCLHSLGEDLEEKSLDLFKEFSKRGKEKYDKHGLMKFWYTIEKKEDGFKIGSLFFWLKQDNPKEYEKLFTKEIKNNDPLRFRKAYYSKMKYEDEKWKGFPDTDAVTSLMNNEIMRTKANEYIQLDKNDTHFLMTKKDIIDDYAMYSFPKHKGDGVINPFNVFLNNINRKNIIGLKFDPSEKEDKNYFNIYKGFQYKLTDDNDYSKIKDYLFHIKDVWANGDDDIYNYILNWFSHIYQKPEKKTLVAIVIPSNTQGNGKNLALKAHSEIMEDLYFSTAQIDQIVGNFNPSAEGRLLINLNECTWGGRKSQSGILKALITEDTMTINNKNIKPYMIENYSNVIITSNDENPIEIEKNDRRYFVLDIKEEKLSQERVNAILKTDNQVLFNFFMNRDISDFDPVKFTKTKKQKEMKESNFGSEYMFWRKCLEENYIEYGDGYTWDILEKIKYKVHKHLIFSCYDSQNYGYNQKLVNSIFWKNTNKIFPKMKLTNATKNSKPKCEMYNLDDMKKDFINYYKIDEF